MGLGTITRCEVCGSESLAPVLDLGNHPMCDDLIEVGSDRVCKEYPIEILYCGTCATGHQRFQIPKDELFPKTYHYRSRHTADVLNGMRELVSACGEKLGPLAGKKVLDIGCNDGSLLSIFRQQGAVTVGIEPTGAAADARGAGHTVIEDFLTEEVAARFVAAHGRPDIVTFTNVFAHIEDLPAVIRSLLVIAHAGTAIVVENHYLGAVIEKRQFDTFYHEHPRTYSYRSFTHIAEALRRRISYVEFPKRYGGNIRVIMTADGESRHDLYDELKSVEDGFGADLEALARDIETWKARKSAELDAAIREHGTLPAKAFPGRSAIPIKLLGIDTQAISAVFEKPASAKIGHYVPGTRIPIVSDDSFEPASADVLVNLAWHIGGEIEGYMRARGFKGGFINIIDSKDFE